MEVSEIPHIATISNTDPTKKMARETKEFLREKFRRDPLTGLLNKGALMNDINRIEKKDRFAVLFIDVDDFGLFNKLQGHDVGDEVLKKIARYLLNSTRPEDNVYRYGGEEMVVFITGGIPKSKLFQRTEEIRSGIAEISTGHDSKVSLGVSVSIGVALREEEEDVQDVVKRADTAMRAIKDSGNKNRYMFLAKQSNE